MAFWQTILVNLAAKTVPAHDALFGTCPKDIDNWLKEIANIRPKEPGLFFFCQKHFFLTKIQFRPKLDLPEMLVSVLVFQSKNGFGRPLLFHPYSSHIVTFLPNKVLLWRILQWFPFETGTDFLKIWFFAKNDIFICGALRATADQWVMFVLRTNFLK